MFFQHVNISLLSLSLSLSHSYQIYVLGKGKEMWGGEMKVNKVKKIGNKGREKA
jgi:hypothetical protein